ncbi:MAG: cysteine desulfurase family protein [Candidatus Geothermincolia bacterium]
MREVYLDHYASTRPLPEVVDAMLPYLREHFGNPSSLHDHGDAARMAVEQSRDLVRSLIGGYSGELIFTGNGTEANNLALKGLAKAAAKRGKHLIVSSLEHFSILHPARTLEKEGFEVTLLPVDGVGRVDPERLAQAIRPDTSVISIMTANGEIGTIQPIAQLSAIARERQVLFHTDAIAAAGSIPIDVEAWGIDALTLSSDLLYGPKGAGALWLKRGVRVSPLLEGGVQEGGRRGGTENVPAIVGFGKAAELAARDMSERSLRLAGLRDELLHRLPQTIERLIVTGPLEDRLPWNASVAIEFIEGEGILLLLNARGIAVSSGSACTSRALKSSHVLDAIGVPTETAQGSVLFSLGIENTGEDVERVLEELPPIVERLRQMSPLYSKFVKKGGQ